MQELQLQKEKQLQAEKHLQALEGAIKSMRKTECWGRNYAPNFEWPTAQNLM